MWHGAERVRVATFDPGLRPSRREALIKLLEALPVLLDLIAPLPPRPTPEGTGRRHRKHQERVIDEQQKEILALRAVLAELSSSSRVSTDPEVRTVDAAEGPGIRQPVLGQVGTIETQVGTMGADGTRTTDETRHQSLAAPALQERLGTAETDLRRALDNAAREEAMLRELITALARPTAPATITRHALPPTPPCASRFR